MSWKAPGAWKNPSTQPNKYDDSSFPGLQPKSPDATSKIEYEELQQNELLALEAIYGDDFVKHDSGLSAWKVRHCWWELPQLKLTACRKQNPLSIYESRPRPTMSSL
jgi:translation initiation factor 2-alpha kinase 4